MRILPSFVLATPCLVLLASCVGPAQEAQRPAPRPAAPPPAQQPPRPGPTPAQADPPQPSEWQYRPVAPGTWTYRTGGGATLALFGSPATEPRLTVRCDRAARRVSLIRAGLGQGAMTVRTSFGTQSWPATASAAPLPQTIAQRAASDTALDQVAYSRGKFMVEVQGLAPLIVPAWAEVARVIEDCRG